MSTYIDISNISSANILFFILVVDDIPVKTERKYIKCTKMLIPLNKQLHFIFCYMFFGFNNGIRKQSNNSIL